MSVFLVVDGGWSDWSPWSDCSVTCGVGEQTRDRTCTNPEPANGGADCDGLAQETQACDTGVSCPVDGSWSDWSEWSACSVTCGVGEQTRDRTCTNPEPANGGADCGEQSQETRECNTGVSCPVDGGWSDWGPWSTCSVTCGVGEQTRDRTCTNPAPANGGADCDGLTQETQACNTGVLCPVDGGWTDWGSWSACSVTCGVGEQTRDRTCTDPEPANGGADCDGLAQETQACDTGVSCLVIVDGGWTDWGSWSACSVTCGVGEQTRDRTCTNPEPANGGADCDGLAQETQACDTGVSCPVDGGWTDWGSWSACSMTCEVGEQTRDRTCTNPAPAHGGADCDGLAQETQACDTGVSCPVLPTRDCSDVYPHLRPAGNFGRYQNKYCFWSSAWRNRRLNYTKAQQECESNGGTLAMIKDASVQAFINNLLKTSSGRTQRNYWIGLDDLNREGVFEWNDGTKLGSYRRFKSKRPHKIRDCVALWRTAKLSRWFPLKCKIHLPYICQMDYNVNN
ncbi:coadhesin-like isoform X2 [Branchiostoma floridae]|uniref:Coadhesin-like isoform X2 n=1 Tax=Branchiostoma floridae TaxID=7739 RepID=A0A9J7KQC4_BRAFL|nr:coadhesin-like isoform X2 [Branchiostoma floridae]